MTELVYSDRLFDKLKDKILVLDTCILVELARCPELYDLFTKKLNNGYKYLITTDVYSEFQRGATTMAERKRYNELIVCLSIGVFQGVDTFCMTSAGAKIQLVLSKINSEEKQARNATLGKGAPDCKPSIVDERLLYLTMTSFVGKELMLVTENYTDVPLELFDSKGTLAISDRAGIRSIGFYAANMKKISKRINSVK